MLDRRFKSRHLLTQRRTCCPGLPRGPEQAPAPWSPPSAACAPRIIELSGGCWKFEKIDLPPTMLDRRFKSRHLLTQRRACCPGLPRGPEQAPAPWSPPSAACAPRIIEFSGGCQKIEKIDLPPTMLDRRFKSRHLLTQRRACCPGLPRGPEQAPAPWSPPSAACAPRIIEFSRGVLEIRENRPPPDDAGPALPEPASAYPEARMLPRAAPRPRAGACTLESSLRCLRTSDHRVLPWGVGNSRKSTSPRRCWTGASRAGICLPRGAHAAPGCPEAPSRRLHPGVLPPLPAHLGSSSSPVGCWKFEKIDLPPTMLDRRFKSRHLLTQRRACCPGLPRGPEQAPAPWSPPSAACAPRIIEFSRGVLEIRENRPPPDDAGPALPEPASAYPEARMLPRAAPRPRAGACTLESSLRCLRTSDHRVLRGLLEIRENRPPPDDAGPALQEPASAYPEARMLPRAAPRPRAGACTLESSLRCLRTSDHRVLRGMLEIRENRPPPDDAGPALQEPASAYPETRMLPRAAPRPRAGACTLESSLRCLRTSDHRVLPWRVGNSRKSTSPRRCWTGASRAGICLPRGAHAAPGCPEAPSRRLHLGVLPPLPAHLGSSTSPVGCWKFEKIDLPPTMLDRGFQSRHLLTQRRACCPGLPRGPEQAPAPWSPPSAACAPRIIDLSRGVLEIRENRPPPDDAGPALQEPASAYPETRMLPRAAPRPRAGACTLESSLRCLRTSDHRVLRGLLEIRENRPPPDDAGPALQEPASAYPETRMLPRAAPRPRAGACTLESSLRCLRTSDHRVLRGVLEIRENRPPPDDAGPALQEPASAYPEARMLPRAAPRPRAGACTLESSLRCLRTSDHRVLRGLLEIRENRPPPDDAGPALQEPASAYPETRMLPRAAPRPRAGACTLESSLRCLRTSDHRVLPWRVGNSRKSTSPRRC
jgi:hypothetical protein